MRSPEQLHEKYQNEPMFHQEPKKPSEGISREHREILEKNKIKLTMMEDFNLIDAFRIFDVEGVGSVTAKQIQDGLN